MIKIFKVLFFLIILNCYSFAADSIIQDELYKYQEYLKSLNFEQYYLNYLNNENTLTLANKNNFPYVVILSYGFYPFFDDTLEHIFINTDEIENNFDDDSNGIIDDSILVSFRNRNEQAINYLKTLDFSLIDEKDLLINHPGFLAQLIIGSDIDSDYYAGLLPTKESKMVLIDIMNKDNKPVYIHEGINHALKLKEKYNISAILVALPENLIKNINEKDLLNLKEKNITLILPNANLNMALDLNKDKKIKKFDELNINNSLRIKSSIINAAIFTGLIANLKLNCPFCKVPAINNIIDKKGNIDMNKLINLINFNDYTGLGFSLY